MRLFIQPYSNIAVLRPETGNNSNIKARFNFIIHDLSSRQKMSCCTKSVLDLPLPLLYQSLTELKYNYILYLLYNLFVSHQWNHWLSDENSSEFIWIHLLYCVSSRPYNRDTLFREDGTIQICICLGSQSPVWQEQNYVKNPKSTMKLQNNATALRSHPSLAVAVPLSLSHDPCSPPSLYSLWVFHPHTLICAARWIASPPPSPVLPLSLCWSSPLCANPFSCRWLLREYWLRQRFAAEKSLFKLPVTSVVK